MTTLLSGIYTASLTPITSKYEPNLPALVDHVEQLFELGSDGVAILGSTGEASSLSIEQRIDIISYCGEKLNPERLLIGTGSCAIKDATRLTKASIDAGIFRVLVIPPYYYKPQSDEGILRYYSELISSLNESRLRVIFYNFPKLSGYNFSVEILQELKMRLGNIAAGIKDSSGNWENMLKITKNISEFMVFSGTETFLLEILREGGAGCISASANLLAPECQLVYQFWKKGEQEFAEKYQEKLSDLRKVLETYPFVSELKGLLNQQDQSKHWQHMLAPFTPLMESKIKEILERLNNHGLDLSNRIR